MRLTKICPGFVVFLLIILSGIIFISLWWNWANQPICVFQAGKRECPEISFIVRKGDGIDVISSNLLKKGLVRSPLAFKIQVFKNNLIRKIQAGEFYLSSGDSPLEIAKILTRGTFDKKVTIIEGWRAEEIGGYLRKEGINIDFEVWRKEVYKRELEGYLFPDTYMIPKDASVEKIITILTTNFNKKFSSDLEKAALAKGIDKHSVVILASLIEREVKDEKDRPIVAEILLKRLAKNWPLQVDATVQYAIANERCSKQTIDCDWWPKKMSNKDLNIDSPYNTYLNRGLPPGPICNPGLSAIKAVIYPQPSPYWFYLSDSEGHIHYARTNKEQLENIKRYLK